MVGGTVCNIESLDPIEAGDWWLFGGRLSVLKQLQVFLISLFLFHMNCSCQSGLCFYLQQTKNTSCFAFDQKRSLQRSHPKPQPLSACVLSNAQMAALKMSTCFEGSFTLPDLAASRGHLLRLLGGRGGWMVVFFFCLVPGVCGWLGYVGVGFVLFQDLRMPRLENAQKTSENSKKDSEHLGNEEKWGYKLYDRSCRFFLKQRLYSVGLPWS